MIPCIVNGRKVTLKPEQIIGALNKGYVEYWDFKVKGTYDFNEDYKSKEAMLGKAYEYFEDDIIENNCSLDIEVCRYKMKEDGDPEIIEEYTENLEFDKDNFVDMFKEHNINHLLV